MASIEHLLKQAKQRDPAAFEALVKPHLPSLRRVAYAFCRDWVQADDLAQDALLKAFRSLHTFEGGSEMKPWLYAVVRSVCTDWYRSRRARMAGSEVQFDDELCAPDADTQEQMLHAKGDAERLWAAIRTLKPDFRVPLVLFDIEGMSYEEISRIERVPVGTVRSRLARGRKRLAELLALASVAPGLGTFPPPLSSSSLRLAK